MTWKPPRKDAKNKLRTIKIVADNPLFFEKKVFRYLYNKFHKFFGKVSGNKGKYSKYEREIYLNLYSKINNFGEYNG